MPRSSNSFLFPDINVWLALSYERHIHCSAAQAWFASLSDDVRLCFCRFTQLGLLRLLTTDAVMGGDRVLSQAEAWNAYDRLVEDDRIHIVEEPSTLEVRFRALSHQKRPAPKDWADSYLLAFADAAGMKLVTFDQALRSRARHVLLLPT